MKIKMSASPEPGFNIANIEEIDVGDIGPAIRELWSLERDGDRSHVTPEFCEIYNRVDSMMIVSYEQKASIALELYRTRQ